METKIAIVVLALAIAIAPLLIWLDIRYERREITRFLRLVGARVQRFRWKPFVGLFGIDNKSKHYEVDFEEGSGRVVRAIFTYTTGVGVMMTERREAPPSQ